MHTTLKQVLLVSLASVTLLGACKKGNDNAARMKEFKEKMCACADKKDGAGDCAKKITDEMTKWAADNAGKTDTAAKQSDEEAENTKKFTECATKAMMAGMGSGGAAAGSGGAMAGSGGGAMAGSGGGAMAGSGGGDVKDIANTDDYKKRNEAMLAKFKDVYKGKDCAKVAAALKPVVDQSVDEMKAIRAYEHAHPEDENAFDDAHKDAEKPMLETYDACGSNAAFKDALTNMPN